MRASVNVGRHELLKRAEHSTSLNDNMNDLEIFFHLCVGRVYYRAVSQSLYFVDSSTISISDTIHQVFKGLSDQPQIQQLYLDVHSLFNAAFKIELTAVQRDTLLVALKLRGIKVEVS